MRELLSVIVLTYKHENYLIQTLDSIFEQNYSNIELIIAEDGDPNFNKKYIEDYIKMHAQNNIKNVVFSINNHNVGTVRNINNALQKSSGEYIKIIAGDDVYSNGNVFSKQVSILESNSDIEVVVGNIVECDDKLNPLIEIGFCHENSILLEDRKELLKYITQKRPQLLSTQAICYKKSFFEEHGMFDERFKFIEDLPMVVKIITNDIIFKYIDYPCVNHRGAVGVSTSKKKLDRKKVQYYIDLKTYFETILRPVNNIVDSKYIEMRIKLYEFRICFVNTSNGLIGALKKVGLLIKYAYPLGYYFIRK